jgi:predicted Zn-dependent protease
VDDEGTATAPLRLVAGGRPESAYHSRHTASVLRAAPTGHARRGTPLRRELERPVRPVLTDVRVELASTGGPVRQGSWSDLIGGVRRGIVVDSLLGAGQARQGGAAQHRLEGRVRLGWVVEAGRVVGRLEPVSVSVPLVEVLVTRLRAVSFETWPVGRAWTGRLPFLVVSGVRFR